MEELLKQFDLTVAEMNEYAKLKDKIFGTGIFKSLFVELDFKIPEHKRLNELAGKVVKLNAHLLANRHKPQVRSIIEGWD